MRTTTVPRQAPICHGGTPTLELPSSAVAIKPWHGNKKPPEIRRLLQSERLVGPRRAPEGNPSPVPGTQAVFHSISVVE
jgi:hypothetical protein